MNKSAENKPRLLDQVRDKLRLKRYSYRPEQTYIDWIKCFILFHNKQHPDVMGKKEIEAFLTYLAVKRNVAASTQNQALCALLFLYKVVLGRELEWLESMQRAKCPARLPVVLTIPEVQKLLNHLEGSSHSAHAHDNNPPTIYHLPARLLHVFAAASVTPSIILLKKFEDTEMTSMPLDGSVGRLPRTALTNLMKNHCLYRHINNPDNKYPERPSVSKSASAGVGPAHR